MSRVNAHARASVLAAYVGVGFPQKWVGPCVSAGFLQSVVCFCVSARFLKSPAGPCVSARFLQSVVVYYVSVGSPPKCGRTLR